MAISPNFFNKRETESASSRHVVPLPTQGATYGAPSPTTAQPVASPVVVAANNASAAAPTGGSKLIVGPNISKRPVNPS